MVLSSPTIAGARGKPCRYCGIPMTGKRPTHFRAPTRDHVVPQSRGGSGGVIVVVCLACNQDKGMLSIGEWYRHLVATNDPRADRVWDVILEIEAAHQKQHEITEQYRGRPMPEAAIAVARTLNGGWDRATLEEWGVPWPPPKGWKRQLMKHGLPWCAGARERETQELAE